MAVDTFSLGFRIVGPCTGERRLVDWQAAFDGYAACDGRAHVEQEGYLSAFTFDQDFDAYLKRAGSTKGFVGPCFGPWVWFDIDRDSDNGGIEAALNDTRTLLVHLQDAFAIDQDDLLCFFSGSKGFHVGLPTEGFKPIVQPGPMFHRIARHFAENAAKADGMPIDSGVYDRVRAFRAPNSRHPKTGLHKRRFAYKELLYLDANRILELAAKPQAFEITACNRCSVDLPAEWNRAAEEVRQDAETQAERRTACLNGGVGARLNRLTLQFIREGAEQGDRHRLLYSAAANLAELGAPLGLSVALLEESALDSGLPPRDVQRAIENGWQSVLTGTKSANGDAEGATP